MTKRTDGREGQAKVSWRGSESPAARFRRNGGRCCRRARRTWPRRFRGGRGRPADSGRTWLSSGRVSAGEPIAEPSSRSRSTAQQASRSGERGSSISGSSSPAIRKSIVRGPCWTSKGRRRGWPLRQTQNGASRQSPCIAECRHRMVLAADPVERTVLRQHWLWISWNRGNWARRWQANQRKPSVWQTWLKGTSRLQAPHEASTSWRARARLSPSGILASRLRTARGQ